MDLPEPHRTRTVELNRTTLRLWEWGEPGALAIICVHGAYDHGRMWDELAPALADQGAHVVAPDLRGHGDSGRLHSGHIWTASALDLALLAREIGAPVGFVGHSFGGGQTLFVAAVWPELVRWVVNIEGLGPSEEALRREAGLAESVTDGIAAAQRVTAGPPRTYEDLEEMAERRRRINVRLPEPWLEHLTRHGARRVDGGWAWKADPMFSVGFPDDFGIDVLDAQFALVECPVVAVTGTEPDTWSDLDEAEIARRVGILRARHRSVPGTGHYVHIERPDAVLATVHEVMAEVDR